MPSNRHLKCCVVGAGQDVYADFGGWHLYLRDMKGTADLKMAQVLADAIGTKVRARWHAMQGCVHATFGSLSRRLYPTSVPIPDLLQGI